MNLVDSHHVFFLMDFAAVVANLHEYENIENDGCVYMFATEPNIRDNKP